MVPMSQLHTSMPPSVSPVLTAEETCNSPLSGTGSDKERLDPALRACPWRAATERTVWLVSDKETTSRSHSPRRSNFPRSWVGLVTPKYTGLGTGICPDSCRLSCRVRPHAMRISRSWIVATCFRFLKLQGICSSSSFARRQVLVALEFF